LTDTVQGRQGPKSFGEGKIKLQLQRVQGSQTQKDWLTKLKAQVFKYEETPQKYHSINFTL
jgi:hypothetical protein